MGLSRFREWCGFRETHELPRQWAEDVSGGGCPLETERPRHRLLPCGPPHALGESLFLGALPQQCCLVWVIQTPTTHMFSASCLWVSTTLAWVSTTPGTETGLYDCLSSPGRTHSPRIIHEWCAFTEDLVQKRAEVCLAQSSTGTRPNKTNKTKHRNLHTL